jgi:hypothetical protein
MSGSPVRSSLMTYLALALVAAGAGACGEGDATASDQTERRKPFTVETLDQFVLRPDEAPKGTEFVEGSSGPFTVEELWPSDCCLGLQLEFEELGFRSAYGSRFEKPGYSGDPLVTRPGMEYVNSTAVLFSTDDGASDAMESWYRYFRAPSLDAVSTEGLGDEAIGVMGAPEAPAETVVLYLWRIGRLVLAVRAGGGTGTIGVGNIRPLADRMDERAT